MKTNILTQKDIEGITDMLQGIFSDPVSAITFVIMWVFIIPAVQRWWTNRKKSGNEEKVKDIDIDNEKYPNAKRHRRNY